MYVAKNSGRENVQERAKEMVKEMVEKKFVEVKEELEIFGNQSFK